MIMEAPFCLHFPDLFINNKDLISRKVFTYFTYTELHAYLLSIYFNDRSIDKIFPGCFSNIAQIEREP